MTNGRFAIGYARRIYVYAYTKTYKEIDGHVPTWFFGSVITALFVPIITNMEHKTRAATTSLRLRRLYYYCYHDGNYAITREPAEYLRVYHIRYSMELVPGSDQV